MRFSSGIMSALTAALLSTQVLGQDAKPFTESKSGITFSSQPIGDSQFGIVLPSDAASKDSNEYIGYYVGSLSNYAGYGGISHSGSMPSALLLMLWPYQGKVTGAFRYANGYAVPELYNGDAKFTVLQSTVNATHFTAVYRCENCWSWTHSGIKGNQSTQNGYLLVGWAQAHTNVTLPSSPSTPMRQHEQQGIAIFTPADAASPNYSSYLGKFASTSSTNGTSVAPTTTTAIATSTSTPTVSSLPAPTEVYDYIVVGAGAGGIPIADKLSESGKSVLLIERGPPSSYRWGGRHRPDWLNTTNVTRFDVPGLDNEIWVDSAGIACTDIDQMAGCVLGGGVAVNAGLWWKTPDLDFDFLWPSGWKSKDTKAATDRVFQRIPGTERTSKDGHIYLSEGYNLLGGAFAAAGWKNVSANVSPNEKTKSFAHPSFMFQNGERDGPMATYLVSASSRKNFKLIMNTDVHRVIRTGSKITGVQIAAYGDGGYSGVVNVAATGRVILSAGTFGSSRILLRSGIGQQSQLQIVNASSDGPTMIGSKDWINLPVGKNLQDHLNTDLVISHPSIRFYDFYVAYDTPDSVDRDMYLQNRSGILAQSAPNIAPMFWDTINGTDHARSLQWTARAEGSRDQPNNYSMTLSQYLGRGSTSRGEASITQALTMTVTQHPFLRTQEDLDAVIQGIDNVRNALSKVANLTWLTPTPNVTTADYVKAYPVSANGRRSNHWLGTNKMGSDDGRAGGTAVVDLNLKVYGTDNLHVVDASIFPGMMTGNPSAMIVTVAEHVAPKILALSK